MRAARVLVVDDNPTNLKLASDVLDAEGYQVTQAANAEEALSLIQQSPPDLILMDIALPGMDGLDLTRKLKADSSTRQIVIVALTAFAMRGDEAKAYAAGCNGYITKPIDTRRLPDQVAGFLRGILGAVQPSEMKVLVIEDDPPQLKLAHRILASSGHHVTEADAADSALAAIRKDRPEVILLDLTLPGMDGLTLTRKLKAEPETRDIPIVAITAFPERFPQAAALEAGCDAYLIKPVDTRRLCQEIESVAARRRAPQPPPQP